MPPLPSNNTKRLKIEMTINQQMVSTILRIRADTDETDIANLITDYGECLTDIHTMSGLVNSTRQSSVSLDSFSVADEGDDFFVPFSFSPIICSVGVGEPSVGDLLSLTSITGRTSFGGKWMNYFSGIAMDIGASSPSANYGDMKLTVSEVPSLGPWFLEYWGPGGEVAEKLVGIDGSPLLFVRERLLVRYSSRKTNSLRR